MYKNKKMKTTIFLLLLLSAFLFAGCHKKQVGAEEDNAVVKEEEPQEEKETYKFGFSCIAKENPYYVTLADSIREALTEEGHTVIGINKDTNLDPDLQIQQIQERV